MRPDGKPTLYNPGDLVETTHKIGGTPYKSLILIISFDKLIEGSTELEEYMGYWLFDESPGTWSYKNEFQPCFFGETGVKSRKINK